IKETKEQMAAPKVESFYISERALTNLLDHMPMLLERMDVTLSPAHSSQEWLAPKKQKTKSGEAPFQLFNRTSAPFQLINRTSAPFPSRPLIGPPEKNSWVEKPITLQLLTDTTPGSSSSSSEDLPNILPLLPEIESRKENSGDKSKDSWKSMSVIP
ncbi:unnamed protein product, partial [Owenia fusiformis]